MWIVSYPGEFFINWFLISINVSLILSWLKFDFLKLCLIEDPAIKKLSLSAITEKKRIEKLDIGKADLIVSRALAPLHKLLAYSLFLSNKNTTSLFLKGRNVYNEIEMAKKNYHFNYEVFKSISSEDGCVLKIKKLKTKKQWKK